MARTSVIVEEKQQLKKKIVGKDERNVSLTGLTPLKSIMHFDIQLQLPVYSGIDR